MAILLGTHINAGARGINHEIKIRGSEVAQIIIGSPAVRTPSAPLRDGKLVVSWDAPVYAHCSYLVNPISLDPHTRARSITSINHQMSIAKLAGIKGLVIHGGNAMGGSLNDSIKSWADALSRINFSVPLIIKNDANGSTSPTSTLEGWRRLWNVAKDFPEVRVCIDSCHAYASDIGVKDVYERIMDITGRVDLVHANGSLDLPRSGKDKHSNLFDSRLPLKNILELIRSADSPVILETPGGMPSHLAELKLLREMLGMSAPVEAERPTKLSYRS